MAEINVGLPWINHGTHREVCTGEYDNQVGDVAARRLGTTDCRGPGIDRLLRQRQQRVIVQRRLLEQQQ